MHSEEAPPSRRLVGAAEAARRLGVHRATITRAIHTGRLTPAAKLPGKSGAYLLHAEDIDRLTGEAPK